MSDCKKTREDLKLEAKRHIQNNTDLYLDVVHDLSAEGLVSKTFILHEVMRRVACTNSSFEHLAE